MGSITFLGMGGSLALYILQNLWSNFYDIMITYTWLVIGYFVTAAIVSFAVCYYKGPVQNIRAQNLVRWALRCISCILIYNGSQIPEVSVATVLFLFLLNWLPVELFLQTSRLW